MKYLKIQFNYIQDTQNDKEDINLLLCYLGCLYKNGQILRDYELIKKKTSYLAFVTIPENNSLDIQYNNIYVNEELNKVRDIFLLSFEIIGENLNYNSTSCECKNPSWYMLYSDFTSIESPVICGDCGKTVPLYKLPYLFSEEEHYTILSWQRSYRSVDRIWMECLADRFSYRQISHPNSQLTINGKEICCELEKQIQKPVYYYLFHANKPITSCPSCNKPLEYSNNPRIVDYKCETCRFVMDISYSFH